MESFDIVIIGGGPGGYVAAIKAAQLGFRVACVEERQTLGGTCLNVGCIPSKALLHASHKFHEAQHLDGYGIGIKGVALDLGKMMDYKNKVVEGLTQGIQYLFKKNKVTFIHGLGSLTNKKGEVEVRSPDNTTTLLEAKHIILATGSLSVDIPGVMVDEKKIVTSTGALALDKVPARLAVIGGGYIGLEMASVWNRLGSKVTVIEFGDRIVPMMDHELGDHLKKSLEKQGIEFMFSTKVTGTKIVKNHVLVSLEDVATGDPLKEIEVDVVLVSVGRKPNTKGLGLENQGIQYDLKGYIPVDHSFQTTAPGIYAIGDIIKGPMLAHKAEEEGIAVVEGIHGQHPSVNYDAIPSVIYTMPEVASVGKTEEELKQAGINYIVGKFPFAANSRAKAIGQTEGFVKVLTHAETDRILGAHIISADAGTLISELTLGMEYKASAEDIARTTHPHPTTSEAIKEAAMAAFDKPIHM